MKHEELAELLHGREIRNEMTEQEEDLAQANGLVVIFGASDDLAEIRGAIHDEAGVCDGGLIYFAEGDLLRNECYADDCPHEVRRRERATEVKALWCAERDDGASWSYKAPFEHSTFKIMEDGDVFCEGIVFDVESIK